MSKPKSKTVYYAIRREKLADEPVAAVLDMLRYDGAIVECNPPSGYWMFSITRTDGAWPTVHYDRWQSFGITVDAEGVDYIDLCDKLREPVER